MAELFNSGFGTGTTYGLQTAQFPDPFLDAASLAMPRTQRDVNLWCEFLLLANGVYREALARIIAYFVTKIEIVSTAKNRIGSDEKQKYEEYLAEMGVLASLRSVALDYIGTGNSFFSMYYPFKRFMACSKCGLQFPLERMNDDPQFAKDWKAPTYTALCPSPKCKKTRTTWVHQDRRTGDAPRVVRWSPHEMEINYERTSDSREYRWRPPEGDRAPIMRGSTFQLATCRWEIIEAMARKEMFKLFPGEICHLREETLAGVRTNGWGLSRVFTNFRQAWYLQILQRYNEAIALDYVVPFRVIAPEPRAGAGQNTVDPAETYDLGDFRSNVLRIIDEHRLDPAAWHVSPYPLKYMPIGGDARSLAPKELIDQAVEMLLASAGIPVEFFKANLSAQSFPAAARLFEANMAPLAQSLNRALGWIVEHVSRNMGWEPVTARLTPPTIADDITKQMAKMQLMLAGKISDTTGLDAVNINRSEEDRRKIDEEQERAVLQADAQKEMQEAAAMESLAADAQQQAAGGAPPPAGGGMPAQPMGPMGAPMGGAAASFSAAMPGSPSAPQSIMEYDQAASVLAGQILSQPASQRRSTLAKLRQDPQLHALVTAKIQQTENQLETQGREMLLQQQFGKQGSLAAWLRKTSATAGQAS